MAIKNLSFHSTLKKKWKLTVFPFGSRWSVEKLEYLNQVFIKEMAGGGMRDSITSKRHIFYPFISSPLFFSFL